MSTFVLPRFVEEIFKEIGPPEEFLILSFDREKKLIKFHSLLYFLLSSPFAEKKMYRLNHVLMLAEEIKKEGKGRVNRFKTSFTKSYLSI